MVFEDAMRSLEIVKESDGFERLLAGEEPDASFNQFGPFSSSDWNLMVQIFAKGDSSVQIDQAAQTRIDSALISIYERASKLLEKEKKTRAVNTRMPLSTLSEFETLKFERLQQRELGSLYDKAFTGQALSAAEEAELLLFGEQVYGFEGIWALYFS